MPLNGEKSNNPAPHSCVRKYVFHNRFKGALDMYNISLLISNSINDFEENQYHNSQMIMRIRFHFMRYFVNSIIFIIQKGPECLISHSIVYLLKSTLKMIEILIFLH